MITTKVKIYCCTDSVNAQDDNSNERGTKWEVGERGRETKRGRLGQLSVPEEAGSQ